MIDFDNLPVLPARINDDGREITCLRATGYRVSELHWSEDIEEIKAGWTTLGGYKRPYIWAARSHTGKMILAAAMPPQGDSQGRV